MSNAGPYLGTKYKIGQTVLRDRKEFTVVQVIVIADEETRYHLEPHPGGENWWTRESEVETPGGEMPTLEEVRNALKALSDATDAIEYAEKILKKLDKQQ